MSEKKHRIKSYVIRKGHMTKLQLHSYNSLRDLYCIPYGENTDSVDRILRSGKPLIVEIGFGMGIATSLIAEKNPDKMYIGIEVHIPGIGKLLSEIHKRSLNNLYIIEHDAVEVLMHMVPENSLEALHLFFPDPWPKKKHHKRRLITASFLELAAKRLKSGGYFHAVTDWEDYANQIHKLLDSSSHFNRKSVPDVRVNAESWRPTTKFEKKGISENHTIREFIYTKN